MGPLDLVGPDGTRGVPPEELSEGYTETKEEDREINKEWESTIADGLDEIDD